MQQMGRRLFPNERRLLHFSQPRVHRRRFCVGMRRIVARKERTAPKQEFGAISEGEPIRQYNIMAAGAVTKQNRV